MAQERDLDALAHSLAGTGGGALAMFLLYPLENIRIRLQVQKRPAPGEEPEFKNGLDAFLKILKNEGYQELYRGLRPAIIGVATSSAVYFFWYNLFKKYIINKRQSLTPAMNVLVASIAGIINVFATCPLWTASVQITMDKTGNMTMTESLKKIYQKSGLNGLYAGLSSSLILVVNPVIQFVVYDQIKSIVLRMKRKTLSSMELFFLGALAKTLATVLTYPIQVVKSRMQCEDNSSVSIMNMIHSIFKNEGPSAFYSGMSSKIFQSVSNSAFMFMTYEKLLHFIFLLMASLGLRRSIASK